MLDGSKNVEAVLEERTPQSLKYLRDRPYRLVQPRTRFSWATAAGIAQRDQESPQFR